MSEKKHAFLSASASHRWLNCTPSARLELEFENIVLLSKCAELWAFGDNISEGMRIEISKAKRKGQPIRYFNDNCEEVQR